MERLEILNLAPQGLGTEYSKCPACGRAKKFSVSRLEDGSILYHCFRPSCKLHRGGYLTPNGVRTLASRQISVTYVTRPYKDQLETLPDDVRAMLEQEIGFTDWHFDTYRLLWAPDVQRVAYPIVNPMGIRDGWCLRSYIGDKPKALTAMEQPRPSHSYYGSRSPDTPTVIVEDIPSAMRASMYLNSVALLGAGLGNDSAIEIAAHRPNVIFALDKDATAQSLRLVREHRLLFNSCSIITLPKDLKNMSDQELREVIAWRA